MLLRFLLKKIFFKEKNHIEAGEVGKAGWKFNYLCLLFEEFLDYSYFETKIFQFKNRSGEIGTDWSLVEKN